MNSSRPRSIFRLFVLVLSLLECLVRFQFLYLRKTLGNRRGLSIADRAAWMHQSCALALRRLGIKVTASGPIPPPGLLVSNHLSYFDILVFGAALPCIFVSKSEVKSWPLFGLLAGLGGTLFIERGNPESTAIVARQIEERLSHGVAILVFPEGTSSDGSSVFKFHSSLFEPAAQCGARVTAAAIGYASGKDIGAERIPESDLCYYGDKVFVPHLVETLGHASVEATVRFSDQTRVYPDRRTAATTTWDEVVALRQGMMRPAVEGSPSHNAVPGHELIASEAR